MNHRYDLGESPSSQKWHMPMMITAELIWRQSQTEETRWEHTIKPAAELNFKKFAACCVAHITCSCMDTRHHCARSIGWRTSNPCKISTEMASGCMTLVKSVCEAYFFYRNILNWWLSSDILTNNSKVVVPRYKHRSKTLLAWIAPFPMSPGDVTHRNSRHPNENIFRGQIWNVHITSFPTRHRSSLYEQ